MNLKCAKGHALRETKVAYSSPRTYQQAMPVIAQDLRIDALRKLQLSDALIAIASGEELDPAFLRHSITPPYYVYAGAHVPDGPLCVPLWDEGDAVFAVWEKPDGYEFIEFSIEEPEAYTIISRSEQGFWANRFDWLYELDSYDDDALEHTANAVSFRYWSYYLAERQKVEGSLNSYIFHQNWVRSIVEQIDQQEKA
jgi:hypothetical protein